MACKKWESRLLLYLVLLRPLLERCALPAEPPPVRCPSEARARASKEEGLGEVPGEESSPEGRMQVRGAASQHVEVFSRSITSAMRSIGCKLQRFRVGVEVVFSGEQCRLRREASGVFTARLGKAVCTVTV